MPSHNSREDDDSQRLYPLRIADEFTEGLAAIYSNRVLTQIKNILTLLPVTPELGSAHVRPMLTRLYGPGIRKIPVSTFVIIYRFDGEYVDVLALVYGPRVK